MISFLRQRSHQPELLDGSNISRTDLYQNLKELDTVNRFLGGNHLTLKGCSRLIKNKKHIYTIADFGCGSGDTLRTINDWGNKNGFSFKLTGIDINADTINYAKGKSKNHPDINFICADYKADVIQNMKFDIILNCLFCHHLNDDELQSFINMIHANSNTGFIINDLHRHWMAYWSIKIITGIFSKSPLVKNDAPLSVWRAFKKEELEILLKKAGIRKYYLRWKWAFRYLAVVEK